MLSTVSSVVLYVCTLYWFSTRSRAISSRLVVRQTDESTMNKNSGCHNFRKKSEEIVQLSVPRTYFRDPFCVLSATCYAIPVADSNEGNMSHVSQRARGPKTTTSASPIFVAFVVISDALTSCDVLSGSAPKNWRILKNQTL